MYHLYNQLCIRSTIDPVALYNEAYLNAAFTEAQLKSNIDFAEWQGIEQIGILTSEKIDLILESLNEACMYKVVHLLSKKFLFDGLYMAIPSPG